MAGETWGRWVSTFLYSAGSKRRLWQPDRAKWLFVLHQKRLLSQSTRAVKVDMGVKEMGSRISGQVYDLQRTP